MNPELREKILAYNQKMAERAQKTADLERIISAIVKLPLGQLNRMLSDEVVALLEKYGITLA